MRGGLSRDRCSSRDRVAYHVIGILSCDTLATTRRAALRPDSAETPHAAHAAKEAQSPSRGKAKAPSVSFGLVTNLDLAHAEAGSV